ncbi:hypothetical protein MRX96_009003 [Rhipicephalus microplus]
MTRVTVCGAKLGSRTVCVSGALFAAYNSGHSALAWTVRNPQLLSADVVHFPVEPGRADAKREATVSTSVMVSPTGSGGRSFVSGGGTDLAGPGSVLTGHRADGRFHQRYLPRQLRPQLSGPSHKALALWRSPGAIPAEPLPTSLPELPVHIHLHRRQDRILSAQANLPRNPLPAST